MYMDDSKAKNIRFNSRITASQQKFMNSLRDYSPSCNSKSQNQIKFGMSQRERSQNLSREKQDLSWRNRSFSHSYFTQGGRRIKSESNINLYTKIQINVMQNQSSQKNQIKNNQILKNQLDSSKNNQVQIKQEELSFILENQKEPVTDSSASLKILLQTHQKKSVSKSNIMQDEHQKQILLINQKKGNDCTHLQITELQNSQKIGSLFQPVILQNTQLPQPNSLKNNLQSMEENKEFYSNIKQINNQKQQTPKNSTLQIENGQSPKIDCCSENIFKNNKINKKINQQDTIIDYLLPSLDIHNPKIEYDYQKQCISEILPLRETKPQQQQIQINQINFNPEPNSEQKSNLFSFQNFSAQNKYLFNSNYQIQTPIKSEYLLITPYVNIFDFPSDSFSQSNKKVQITYKETSEAKDNQRNIFINTAPQMKQNLNLDQNIFNNNEEIYQKQQVADFPRKYKSLTWKSINTSEQMDKEKRIVQTDQKQSRRRSSQVKEESHQPKYPDEQLGLYIDFSISKASDQLKKSLHVDNVIHSVKTSSRIKKSQQYQGKINQITDEQLSSSVYFGNDKIDFLDFSRLKPQSEKVARLIQDGQIKKVSWPLLRKSMKKQTDRACLVFKGYKKEKIIINEFQIEEIIDPNVNNQNFHQIVKLSQNSIDQLQTSNNLALLQIMVSDKIFRDLVRRDYRIYEKLIGEKDFIYIPG